MRQQVRLSQLVTAMRNGTTIDQNDDGRGVPVTRIETISDGTINLDKVRYADVSPKDIDRWRLLPGDILLSHINSVDHIGKSALYDGRPAVLIHGMNLLLLRADRSRILPEFLHYALRSTPVRSRIRARCKRAINQASINQKELGSIELVVPSLVEQHRAVELLARSENIVRMRREAEQKAKEIIPALFLDMFGDPATNPKGWPIDRLGNLCRDISDIDHKMPKAAEKGIPFISAKDLQDNGTISFDDVKMISETDFHNLARKGVPERGDIIYSRIGAKLGKARVVKVDFRFLASYSCCTIKPRHELVVTQFLCSLLDSPFMLRTARQHIRAIAVPDLGLGEIKKFPIIVPPMPMQKDFSTNTQEVSSIIDQMERATAVAAKAFQSLLAGVFGG